MTSKAIAERISQIESISTTGYQENWKERLEAAIQAIRELRLDIERDLLKEGKL